MDAETIAMRLQDTVRDAYIAYRGSQVYARSLDLSDDERAAGQRAARERYERAVSAWDHLRRAAEDITQEDHSGSVTEGSDGGQESWEHGEGVDEDERDLKEEAEEDEGEEAEAEEEEKQEQEQEQEQGGPATEA